MGKRGPKEQDVPRGTSEESIPKDQQVSEEQVVPTPEVQQEPLQEPVETPNVPVTPEPTPEVQQGGVVANISDGLSETELEAMKGIETALETPVAPMIVNIGEIVNTAGGRGIVLDYKKFVKYSYGLIIQGNPAAAHAHVGMAGKNKLFGLLGVTDRNQQEVIWEQFKKDFNS